MNLSARIKYSIIKTEVLKTNLIISSMSTSTSLLDPPIFNPTDPSPASLPSPPTIIIKNLSFKSHPRGQPISVKAAKFPTQGKLKIQYHIVKTIAKKVLSPHSQPIKSLNSSMVRRKVKVNSDLKLFPPVARGRSAKNLRYSPRIKLRRVGNLSKS